MLRLILALIVLLPGYLVAQTDSQGYRAVLQLNSGRDVRGTILEYVHRERVVVLALDGDLETFRWGKIKRIKFEDDPSVELAEASKKAMEQEQLPSRSWFHDVSVGGLFGVETREFEFGGGFREDVRIIGYGISYAHVRQWRALRFGGGVDYSVYNYSRGESSVSLFGLGEVSLRIEPTSRVAPYLRMLAGPALPASTPVSDDEIIARRINLMVHPSAGLEFRTGRNDYNNLFFDVGYRFLNSRFDVTTSTLDVLTRSINYSRFTIRGGYRF